MRIILFLFLSMALLGCSSDSQTDSTKAPYSFRALELTEILELAGGDALEENDVEELKKNKLEFSVSYGWVDMPNLDSAKMSLTSDFEFYADRSKIGEISSKNCVSGGTLLTAMPYYELKPLNQQYVKIIGVWTSIPAKDSYNWTTYPPLSAPTELSGAANNCDAKFTLRAMSIELAQR